MKSQIKYLTATGGQTCVTLFSAIRTSMCKCQHICAKGNFVADHLAPYSPRHHHLPPPTSPYSPCPHRRSSQSRSPLVLDPHIVRPLWGREQQDLPCAGGGHGLVEPHITGAGDDHYLVVLAQVNAPSIQQRLEIGQQIFRRLARNQSLWHCSVRAGHPLTRVWGGLCNEEGHKLRCCGLTGCQHLLTCDVPSEYEEQYWNPLKAWLHVFMAKLNIPKLFFINNLQH